MDKSFSKTYKFGSKEFWRNYWYYYSKHTIIVLLVVIAVISTVYGCVTRIEPDFGLIYIGSQPLSTENGTEAFLAPYVNDINGDGKQTPSVIELAFGGGTEYKMVEAYITKADIELYEGDPLVFITDDSVIPNITEGEPEVKFIDRYLGTEAFEPVDDIVSRCGIEPERLVKNGEHTVAVDITGSDFAKKLGLDSQRRIYAAVKILPERKSGDANYMKLYEESRRMFEVILNDNF